MKKLKSWMMIAALGLSLMLSGCSEKAAEGPRIGVIQLMEHTSLNMIYDSLKEELETLGYQDGENCTIVFKNAQGEQSNIGSIVSSFQSEKLDVVVAIATPTAQSAAKLAETTPVIFSAVTDPVDAGLVSDLEAPDRNLTGTSDAIPVDRIFALADELTPGIKTYGLLYNNGESNSVSVIRDVKVALNAAGIAFEEATVINSSEVTTAAQSLVGKVDAIFSPIDNTVAYAMPNLAQIAIEAKLPVYVAADSMVNDGGLATVGVNYTQLGKQTAQMAAEVLSGKPVSEVPVQVLSEYATVVNPDTAAAIGVDVSKYVK